MRRKLFIAVAALMACGALAGCGGADDESTAEQPAENVRPEVRADVQAAQNPSAADFPAAAGKTLQQLADEIGGAGPRVGLGGSTFTVGRTRIPFGVIGDDGRFLYGPTAVYVARGPGKKAEGPFLAPADVLVTDPAYRSKQAATESDPFAAVYAAEVPFKKPGAYAIFTVTKLASGLASTGTQIEVKTKADDPIPDVGEPAPKVQTDTLDSLGGNEDLLDTRQPPSDMHESSFAQVVGKKPAALLFATPQLCQSRVCGPVVDVALQLREKYGDRIEFIHQEVYADNDLEKGLREPLRRFKLKTEPWLFVVGADGRVTARLEGSFGLSATEQALKTAL
jgi:hypothetical protein